MVYKHTGYSISECQKEINMEINDIKIFVKVAQLKSITQTAEYLGYVQSHISKRINKIEDELNCQLLRRTNRGVDILPKGEEFLSYCIRLLDVFHELEDHFDMKKDYLNINQFKDRSHKKLILRFNI